MGYDGRVEQGRFFDIVGFDTTNVRRFLAHQNFHQLRQASFELRSGRIGALLATQLVQGENLTEENIKLDTVVE